MSQVPIVNFNKQIVRKDILMNMLANTSLSGKDLFTLIMSDNNSLPSSSRQGDLYESLCEILLVLKCIDGLHYTTITTGDLSSLKPIKTVNTLFSNKVHQGGNVSDISITIGSTTICFSITPLVI
jgi:hypothetical protein